MPPKEKAKELVDKYRDTIISFLSDNMKDMNAKKCALIAVDDILYALSVPPIQNKGHLLYDSQIDYWQQVKQEIEKL